MQPGRKGSKHPQLTSVGYQDIPGVQPDPPVDLSPDEAAEWKRIWGVTPAGWFPRETWPLLMQLCRHTMNSRFFAEALQEVRAGLLDPKNPKHLAHINSLCVMHERETRVMVALMEKLRLTTQQRIPVDMAADRQAEATLAPPPKPDQAPWATHQ
jgi:hypothetical protein